MKLPRIVGIAGPSGAGKDMLGDILVELKNYKFVSVSDILREELTKQNIPHEREHMRALSTKWAREHGPSVLSMKTIELYVEEEKAEGYSGLAIGSVRRPAEAVAIQAEGGVVLWIDADQRRRYERIQLGNRGRSEDAVSFDAWKAAEDIEMTPIDGDPHALNMAGVRDIADFYIDNNFTSSEKYRQYLIEEFELTEG